MRLHALAVVGGLWWATAMPVVAQPPTASHAAATATAGELEPPPAMPGQGPMGVRRPPPRNTPPLGSLPSVHQQVELQQQQIEALVQTVYILSAQLQRPGSAPIAPAFEAAPVSEGQGVREARVPPNELHAIQIAFQNLQKEQAAVQAANPADKVQKQLDLQRKQIEVLEKMVKLLGEQAEKGGPAVAKLQSQVATLEARTKQSAHRDQELAAAVDNITEQMDLQQRYPDRNIPAYLKELYFASGTNESPLSVYNTLEAGWTYLPGQQHGPGQFEFGEYSPVFLLQLNNQFLFEAELEFRGSGEVEVGYAQLDWIVTDWLTSVTGRYLTPIGFFNERLHTPWINKMPDFPLMMQTVSLADFSLNGAQLRGAKYLFGSPLKVEYSVYAANGLGTPGAGALTDWADLGALIETTKEVNQAMAFGGRLGFWLPECGLYGGFSYFANRTYTPEAGADLDLWQIDMNYHKGNWDVRFEYAQMFQKTADFIGTNIARRGLYAQVAYRDYRRANTFLGNLELVGRFSYANFNGIDATLLDVTAFDSTVLAPVNRNQYAVGVNYYFAPSLVFKCAYEINQELGDDLRDNRILAQLAWGF